MNNSNPVFAGGSLIGVVTASAITDPLLNITDNSALIDFTETPGGSSTINLMAVAANGCTGTVTGAVTGPCLVAYDSPSLQVAPAGVITSSTAGIEVLSGLSNGASVSGFGINNQGSVAGTNYGIQLMSGATLIGGITNSGMISSTGVAIKLSSATIIGGINNRAGASIAGAAGQGIVISTNSSLDGIGNNGGYISGITNAGRIAANIGIANTGARIVGGINNSGAIAGASYGVTFNASTMTGDFINNGTVSASSQSTVTGTSYSGVYVVNSSIAGQIQNAGRISGGNTGIFLLASTVSGGITNSGVISGVDVTSWDSRGLNLGYSSVTGNVINNAGATMSGGTAGFNMYYSTLSGSLMNSGLIQGTSSLRQSGDAVWIGDSSLVTGGITNAGSIIGVASGISAINGSSVTGAINNSGLISGASGIVVSNSTIGGGITNSGVITGLGGNAVSIVSSPTTNLTNAATGTIVGAISGNTNVSNSGLWALQTTSGAGGAIVAGSHTNASISGTYTQASGATLQVGVNGTNGSGTLAGNYSTLNVSGAASFASGSTISLSMNNAYSLLAGATLTGVVTAGTLSGASNVRVVDNSALLDFTESTAANANRLDIVAYASPTNNIVNAVIQNNNPAALGAAYVLQSLSTNTPPAMQGVIGALNAMPTTLAVSNAVSQTLPTLVGAGSQATAVNQQNLNQIMQGRQNQLRGLSSGEEYIGNKEVWLKGFGSWANQGSVNNVSGYKINTGGLAIGVDKALSPSSNLGGVFAFGNSNLNSNNSAAASTLNINSYQVGVYGDTFVRSDLQVNYQADAGLNSNKETRNLSSFTGVSGVAASSTSGVTANANYNSLSAHLGTGLKKFVLLTENTTFIPSLRADYTSVQSQGYTESGAGSLNLKVNSQTYNMLVTSADFRVDQMLMHQLKLSANVGLGYNLLNNQVQATSTYQGGGAAFTTNGLEVSPWLYNAGLGLSGRISKEVELNVRYDTQFSTTGYNNQMVSGKIKFFY